MQTTAQERSHHIVDADAVLLCHVFALRDANIASSRTQLAIGKRCARMQYVPVVAHEEVQSTLDRPDEEHDRVNQHPKVPRHGRERRNVASIRLLAHELVERRRTLAVKQRVMSVENDRRLLFVVVWNEEHTHLHLVDRLAHLLQLEHHLDELVLRLDVVVASDEKLLVSLPLLRSHLFVEPVAEEFVLLTPHAMNIRG